MLMLRIKPCFIKVKVYLKNRLTFTDISFIFIASLIYFFISINDVAMAQELRLSGNAIPTYVIVNASNSTTFSSETTATIQAINVKEGDRFKTGDILLEFDCRVQRAELKKAQAQQESASSSEKSAQKMKSYGLISDVELIKAQSELAIANAEVDKIKTYIDKCVIEAPFNGGVAELNVHMDETVKPGDPLLKIVNVEKLEFEMQVPSLWLSWLHIGSEFTVDINETKKSVLAKVTKINPEIDTVSQTVKIIGMLVKPDQSLLPGMSGQATFKDAPKNVR